MLLSSTSSSMLTVDFCCLCYCPFIWPLTRCGTLDLSTFQELAKNPNSDTNSFLHLFPPCSLFSNSTDLHLSLLPALSLHYVSHHLAVRHSTTYPRNILGKNISIFVDSKPNRHLISIVDFIHRIPK